MDLLLDLAMQSEYLVRSKSIKPKRLYIYIYLFGASVIQKRTACWKGNRDLHRELNMAPGQRSLPPSPSDKRNAAASAHPTGRRVGIVKPTLDPNVIHKTKNPSKDLWKDFISNFPQYLPFDNKGGDSWKTSGFGQEVSATRKPAIPLRAKRWFIVTFNRCTLLPWKNKISQATGHLSQIQVTEENPKRAGLYPWRP